MDETGQAYAYTGGDPVNAVDPSGLMPSGNKSFMDYGEHWGVRNLAEAISQEVGWGSNVDIFGQNGKIYFVDTSSPTKTAIVLDPDGAYFRIEDTPVPGWPISYRLANGNWVSTVTRPTPKEGQDSHFIVGDYNPTTVDDAKQWFAEQQGKFALEYEDGIRNAETEEGYEGEFDIDFGLVPDFDIDYTEGCQSWTSVM